MDGIRRHWAVVFQRNALFSGTVLDNVSLWLREIERLEDEDEIHGRVVRALEAVGFRADATLLEKQRDELSGGMQKRVAVARAIAMDPLLLFYDEPTTGLDPSLAEQVHDWCGLEPPQTEATAGAMDRMRKIFTRKGRHGTH